MQGASSKLAIRIFYGLIPCILGALSAMVIFFLCLHFFSKMKGVIAITVVKAIDLEVEAC